MTHHYAFASHPLVSEDLTILHNTLQKWCAERRIEISDPEAERAAAELIDWFQFGLRHEDQLIEMIRRT